MKQAKVFIIFLLALYYLSGCSKQTNYPGAEVNPFISILDLRTLYKGSDVVLTPDLLLGSAKLEAIVVSDHSGNNLPEGLLVVENNTRLSQLRGISIALGASAEEFVPGDSVEINMVGATLTRKDNILQLTGLDKQDVVKTSEGNAIPLPLVRINDIVENPDKYESTLLTIVNAVPNPTPEEGDTYSGTKIINDGFGLISVITQAQAPFANNQLPFLGSYSGIIFGNVAENLKMIPRISEDLKVLSLTEPVIAPVVITGFLANPSGSDGNYEYIQFMATREIDFSATPFSVVTTNNAGANDPPGAPVNSWATGGKRTYKFNLDSGIVKKGEYFYIGGYKNIFGNGSTDISNAKWMESRLYADLNSEDLGDATSNLLANSGNRAGIAVFDTSVVDATSVPVDVIFYGGNSVGAVFSSNPLHGFLITNTDYFSTINPVNLESQPYYMMGTNTGRIDYPQSNPDFTRLSGVYNIITGRWTQSRTYNALVLTEASTLAEIEGQGVTTLEE